MGGAAGRCVCKSGSRPVTTSCMTSTRAVGMASSSARATAKVASAPATPTSRRAGVPTGITSSPSFTGWNVSARASASVARRSHDARGRGGARASRRADFVVSCVCQTPADSSPGSE